MPTKSIGSDMIVRSSAVNFGASLPASLRYASVYFPSRMTVRNGAFSSRVAFWAARNVLLGLDERHRPAKNIRRAALGAFLPAGVDSLNSEPVGEHGVVPDLVQFCWREIQARCVL